MRYRRAGECAVIYSYISWYITATVKPALRRHQNDVNNEDDEDDEDDSDGDNDNDNDDNDNDDERRRTMTTTTTTTTNDEERNCVQVDVIDCARISSCTQYLFSTCILSLIHHTNQSH